MSRKTLKHLNRQNRNRPEHGTTAMLMPGKTPVLICQAAPSGSSGAHPQKSVSDKDPPISSGVTE
ncbi:MAG: hypothetical protein EF813_06115 [Methanosarcinales archaeon]|nr:MAG: hypothetical protein EF813_06115 [Methanosarcinales archaeon]